MHYDSRMRAMLQEKNEWISELEQSIDVYDVELQEKTRRVHELEHALAQATGFDGLEAGAATPRRGPSIGASKYYEAAVPEVGLPGYESTSEADEPRVRRSQSQRLVEPLARHRHPSDSTSDDYHSECRSPSLSQVRAGESVDCRARI